jgi:hypothetical protein
MWGAKVVETVDEVAKCGGWRVLDDDEVAVLRSAQALLDPPDLPIAAKPGSLLDD